MEWYKYSLKSLIGLTILLFCGDQGQAQDFGAQLILGFNAAQVDGDQYSGYNKAGLHAGVAVNRRINNKWLGQFELLYNGKGSRKRTSEEDMTIFALRYRYLELPLLAIYELNDRIRFHAGPSAGLLISAEFDDGREWMPANPPLLGYEVAGHIGASYALNDQWEFNVRHSLSILRVGNPNNGTQFYRVTANGLYNRLFSFSLRYGLLGN